jgi:hypothetical protein
LVLPKTENIFKIEAGNSPLLYQKMIKKATSLKIAPVVQKYDMDIGKVALSGEMLFGG